jgi:hypothetical protein
VQALAGMEAFGGMLDPIKQRLQVESNNPDWNELFFMLLLRISQCHKALGQEVHMQQTLRGLHLALSSMRQHSIQMSATMREWLDYFDAAAGPIATSD